MWEPGVIDHQPVPRLLSKPSYIATEACITVAALFFIVVGVFQCWYALVCWHLSEIVQFLSTDHETGPQLQACAASAHEAMTAEVAAAACIKDISSNSLQVYPRHIWLKLYILKWAFSLKVAMSL